MNMINFSTTKLVCATLLLVVLVTAHSAVASMSETDVRLGRFCGLYDGRWVYDAMYPPYTSQNCPFITQQEFNCSGNGRPDVQYQKYKWQHETSVCGLSRLIFRQDFVKRIRGKRIMFIGDSISMNQWQSFACMLYSAVPNTSYQPAKTTGLLSTIVFPKLNVRLMYQRNPMIVEIEKLQNGSRVLKLDSIDTIWVDWVQADIWVFGTSHGWLYTGTEQPWDLLQNGVDAVNGLNRFEAYRVALRNWGRLIDEIVKPETRVFFNQVSPNHSNASGWGRPELQRSCGGEQKPLQKSYMEDDFTLSANSVLRRVLLDMRTTVHLMEITQMSLYRVDGHPSIYGNPSHSGMDCTNWCLPGVPDEWNKLLIATLQIMLA